MSLTCPHCGAENRDSAKFCLKCAHQLVPLGKVEPAPPVARRKRRTRRPAADSNANAALDAANAPTASVWLHGFLIAMAALLLATLIGVLLAQRNAAAPAGARSAVLTPPRAPANGSSALPAGAAASSAAAAPSTSESPAAPAVADLPSAPPSLSAAPLLTALPPARSASASPASARGEPGPRATRAARSAANTTAAAPPASAASEPPAPAPRPASAPAPAAPGALCGDARFLAHAICLQNECSKPALRQHPQCVRMREQQEALRRGSGGG